MNSWDTEQKNSYEYSAFFESLKIDKTPQGDAYRTWERENYKKIQSMTAGFYKWHTNHLKYYSLIYNDYRTAHRNVSVFDKFQRPFLESYTEAAARTYALNPALRFGDMNSIQANLMEMFTCISQFEIRHAVGAKARVAFIKLSQTAETQKFLMVNIFPHRDDELSHEDIAAMNIPDGSAIRMILAYKQEFPAGDVIRPILCDVDYRNTHAHNALIVHAYFEARYSGPEGTEDELVIPWIILEAGHPEVGHEVGMNLYGRGRPCRAMVEKVVNSKEWEEAPPLPGNCMLSLLDEEAARFGNYDCLEKIKQDMEKNNTGFTNAHAMAVASSYRVRMQFYLYNVQKCMFDTDPKDIKKYRVLKFAVDNEHVEPYICPLRKADNVTFCTPEDMELIFARKCVAADVRRSKEEFKNIISEEMGSVSSRRIYKLLSFRQGSTCYMDISQKRFLEHRPPMEDGSNEKIPEQDYLKYSHSIGLVAIIKKLFMERLNLSPFPDVSLSAERFKMLTGRDDLGPDDIPFNWGDVSLPFMRFCTDKPTFRIDRNKSYASFPETETYNKYGVMIGGYRKYLLDTADSLENIMESCREAGQVADGIICDVDYSLCSVYPCLVQLVVLQNGGKYTLSKLLMMQRAGIKFRVKYLITGEADIKHPENRICRFRVKSDYVPTEEEAANGYLLPKRIHNRLLGNCHTKESNRPILYTCTVRERPALIHLLETDTEPEYGKYQGCRTLSQYVVDSVEMCDVEASYAATGSSMPFIHAVISISDEAILSKLMEITELACWKTADGKIINVRARIAQNGTWAPQANDYYDSHKIVGIHVDSIALVGNVAGLEYGTQPGQWKIEMDNTKEEKETADDYQDFMTMDATLYEIKRLRKSGNKEMADMLENIYKPWHEQQTETRGNEEKKTMRRPWDSYVYTPKTHTTWDTTESTKKLIYPDREAFQKRTGIDTIGFQPDHDTLYSWTRTQNGTNGLWTQAAPYSVYKDCLGWTLRTGIAGIGKSRPMLIAPVTGLLVTCPTNIQKATIKKTWGLKCCTHSKFSRENKRANGWFAKEAQTLNVLMDEAGMSYKSQFKLIVERCRKEHANLTLTADFSLTGPNFNMQIPNVTGEPLTREDFPEDTFKIVEVVQTEKTIRRQPAEDCKVLDLAREMPVNDAVRYMRDNPKVSKIDETDYNAMFSWLQMEGSQCLINNWSRGYKINNEMEARSTEWTVIKFNGKGKKLADKWSKLLGTEIVKGSIVRVLKSIVSGHVETRKKSLQVIKEFEMAWATTPDSIQGRTCDGNLIVDLSGCGRPGCFYTSISRCKQLDRIALLVTKDDDEEDNDEFACDGCDY